MNKVILMGRLTKDPEIRYTTTSNIPKCTFTLAVDRRFARQGEEKQTDFFNIVTWRSNAEFCSKYFVKGQKVVVVGSIQNRFWDDNEGKRHYITEIIADETYFADSRKTEGGLSSRPPEYSAPDATAPEHGQGDEGFFQLEDDDELPF